MALALDFAALLIIDVQQGFDDPSWGRRNNPQAEAQIARLLATWRERRWPVFHVQHHSLDPASPLYPANAGHALKALVAPLAGEVLLTKHVNSAFIGTPLEAMLREQQITRLVVTGLTTNHCVETTTRMAGNLGFCTYLVSDATATFDRIGPDGRLYRAEEIHAVSLASIHGEFAQVISTDSILQDSQTDETRPTRPAAR